MKVTQQGPIVRLHQPKPTMQEVPAGIYNIGVDEDGFHLLQRPPFTLPDKIYGEHDEFASRVLKTADVLGHGISTLLSGPKGCGKTLTAKMICLESKRPVICITDAFCGFGFNNFLANLPNQCLIFIDEFEKVYDQNKDRDQLLALLDGSGDKRHIFLLTSNDPNIGEHFDNRPGRLRYHRKYDQLEPEILKAIVKDRVPAGRIRKGLIDTIDDFGGINPDGLMCLIDECLIHQEVPADFLKYFNVFPELSSYYSIAVTTTGYRAKPGLSKARIQRINRFIEAEKDFDREYAEAMEPLAMKDLEEIKETFVTMPTRAFMHAPGQEVHPEHSWINAHYARGPRKQERSFSLRERDVAKIERKGGIITIHTHSNQTWVLTPEKFQPGRM